MIDIFRNIKISYKIPISISIFIILLLLMAFIAMTATRTINKNGQKIYDNYFVSFVNLTDARKYLYEEHVLIKSHIIAPDEEFMKLAEQKINNASFNFHQSLAKFEQTLDVGEETKLLNKLKIEVKVFEELKQIY